MKCDIIVIAETHLKGTNELELPGYQWFGLNRTNINPRATSGSGGVGILVSHSLLREFNVQIVDTSFEGILWIRLKAIAGCSSFLVCAVYLPPEKSSRGDVSQEFFDCLLSQFYYHWQNEPVIISGDFNARIGDDVDSMEDSLPPRVPLDMTKNKFGGYLIDFIQDANMCIVNGRAKGNDNFTFLSTRGRSVVDYVLVPSEQFDAIEKCEVIPVSDVVDRSVYGSCRLPDHSIIRSVIHIAPYARYGEDRLTERINSRESGDLKGYQEDRRYKINGVPINFLENTRRRNAIHNICDTLMTQNANQVDIDQCYEKLILELRKEMDDIYEHQDIQLPFNKRERKIRRKPWWDVELTSLWSKAKTSERKYSKFRGSRDQKRDLLRKFKDDRANFDRSLRRKERQFKEYKMNEIERLRTDNPTVFWNEIKKLGPGKRNDGCITTVEMADGSISYMKEDIMERWKTAYDGLFNHTESENFDEGHKRQVYLEWENITNEIGSGLDNVLNVRITSEEVLKVLNGLKPKKATGADKIPNEVLKSRRMLPILTQMFNSIFDLGKIPSLWNKSIIHPIHKPGKNKNDPLGYRGISLISTIGKTFSAVLNNRLISYSEEFGLIVDEQNGFRAKRGCVDHIYCLTTIIRNRKLLKKPTFLCFVDFSRAFDAIDRTYLMLKLYKIGIGGKFLRAVEGMYKNTSACVRINGHLSDYFDTTAGVRQGDCLSPTLFSLFINDLATEIKASGHGVKINGEDVPILLYADDIVICAETEESLQALLKIMENWCNQWRMSVNADKTKIMHCRRKTDDKTEYRFLFNNVELQLTEKYRYLGVTINENLDYTITSNELAKAASKALGGILGMHFQSGLRYDTYCKLYEAKVATIMDYACPIWGKKTYREMEKVHFRAMRSFLGVGKTSPLSALEGDMGWEPIHVRQHAEIIKLWFKLCGLRDNRLLKRIFLWDYDLANNKNLDNWCRNVKDILDSFGFVDLYNDIDLCCAFSRSEVNDIVKFIRTCLMDTYVEKWSKTVQETPKLRTYKTFKTIFQVEDYVKQNLSRQDRSIIARLRNGTFPINIELGRYRKLPLDRRICIGCDSGEVESELHFICRCNKYKEEREELYRNMNMQSVGEVERLQLLLKEGKFAKILISYIKRAYGKRMGH